MQFEELVKESAASLPFALGKSFPQSPHAVFCSFPTIDDVHAYETQEAWIHKLMEGGYPRFVNPAFCRKLEAILAKSHDGDKAVRLLSSERAGREAMSYLAWERKDQVQIHTDEAMQLSWISFPKQEQAIKKIGEYLQHSGNMIFSREAEDILYARGELTSRHSESILSDQEQESLRSLARDLQAEPEDLFLARSGMSAVFAAYCALSAIQRPKKRSIWIQLGWLYVDSIEVLKKFAPSDADYIYLPYTGDLAPLRKLLASHGNALAAVFTESPSNPLLDTPNPAELAEICKNAGAALVLDNSLACPANVCALPYSDMICASLSKYYGWSGDLIMGAAALNPQSPFYEELRKNLPKYIDPPYQKDKERFAFLLQEFPQVLKKINANTIQMAEYLSQSSCVQNLYWAYQDSSAKNYSLLAAGPGKPGGVLSFQLRSSIKMEDFYKRIAIAKGPSFGTAFSILCPFLYLAHYDLVTTQQGQDWLKANRIHPDLLRFSVGAEPIENLLEIFDKAFASGQS